MKKVLLITISCLAISLSACNGATNKTGGASRDSSASHGYSGASDSTSQTTTTGTSAQSTSGSDTSKNSKGTDAPVLDTSRQKKHD